MTGPEHYREAERLVEAALLGADDGLGRDEITDRLSAAQVHATLAHAAAVAMAAKDQMSSVDWKAWDAVSGVQP